MFVHELNDGMYDWMDSDEPDGRVEDMICMGDVVVEKANIIVWS
jgi:hypothetical protein